jgi:hypothetical protein
LSGPHNKRLKLAAPFFYGSLLFVNASESRRSLGAPKLDGQTTMRRFFEELRPFVFVGLLLFGVGWVIQRLTHFSTSSVVVGVSISVALIVAKAQYGMWVSRVVTYNVDSPAALEPFIRSWAQWLDDGGRIVVRDVPSGAEFEYRKLRFATRPDQLVFRFRNADSTRPFFAKVRAALDREGVEYELELTPKTKKPRAMAVSFDPSQVLTPLVAVGLAKHALRAMGGESQRGLQVRVDGRLRREPDVPAIDLINVSESYRQSHAFGVRLGRLIRRLARPID